MTRELTPLEQYERGLVTLDELVELDPTVSDAWVAEQWIRIWNAWDRWGYDVREVSAQRQQEVSVR